MTTDQIAFLLNELVLRLGNNRDTSIPPQGVTDAEWAYVKGLASAPILRLRDALKPVL